MKATVQLGWDHVAGGPTMRVDHHDESGTAPILALDPGTTETAFVLYQAGPIHPILEHDKVPNAEVLELLPRFSRLPGVTLAVEMIASYGMPVGREVFETCVWIGRFVQAWQPGAHEFVYRRDVKMYLCGSNRAKDGNIRQALLDLARPRRAAGRPTRRSSAQRPRWRWRRARSGRSSSPCPRRCSSWGCRGSRSSGGT
jgi:hypothetical protein